MLISIPCAVGLAVLAKPVTFLLFSSSTMETLDYSAKLLIALSIVYAVLRTASAILGIGNKKRHKKSTAEIIKPKKREKQVEEKVETAYQQTQEVRQEEPVKQAYPKYYRAKQNPNYVFTEYEDRYELFKMTDGKYVYVRTDYKKRG